jgi:hypothetical protein
MNLTIVARSMRNMIDLKPAAWVKRELPRGLQLILSHNNASYRLALAREGVYPSDEEIAICMAHFAVPEGTDPKRFETQTYQAKTGRNVRLYVVELIWRDLDAATIPAPSRDASPAQ